MTLAAFVNHSVQLGAVRPTVDIILQFKIVKFKDFRDAKAASDLLHEIDNSVKFKILDNQDHANLQFLNPVSNNECI